MGDWDDLVNSDAIEHDLEATLACESWVRQESLNLVIVMTPFILVGISVLEFMKYHL